MIFDLAKDFSHALAAMPAEHPKHRILSLLEEAIRRDIHFIGRHPTALFQCMWNTCWWYDCPEAAKHYIVPKRLWVRELWCRLKALLSRVWSLGTWSWEFCRRIVIPPSLPWRSAGPKVHKFLVAWRKAKESRYPGFFWLRSLRPPAICLGLSQRAVFHGHEGGVAGVAFSPDGSRIASGSNWESSDPISSVRVWDAHSGKELAAIRWHYSPVRKIVFSPDGLRIAITSGNAIRIFDSYTGTEVAILRGHKGKVESLAFSPDGTRIASGSVSVYGEEKDDTVRVWDIASSSELAVLRGHEAPGCSVAFFPDGKRIASGANDGTVRVWDTRNGAELTVLHGHSGTVVSVAVLADGAQIMTGSLDETVRVWDVRSGVELGVFRRQEQSTDIWLESGAESVLKLLTGSRDTSGRHPLGITSVAFSSDAAQVATGLEDSTVRVWDTHSGAQLAILRGHAEPVLDIAFSPDGLGIATGSKDGTMRLWNPRGGAQLPPLAGHGGTVDCLAFSPDGTRIASGCSWHDETVRLWDVRNGVELRVLPMHGRAEYLTFSADGTRIASGEYTVRVWDVASGAELAALGGQHYEVKINMPGVVGWLALRVDDALFSLDGSRLVTGSACDNTLRLWDAYSGSHLAIL